MIKDKVTLRDGSEMVIEEIDYSEVILFSTGPIFFESLEHDFDEEY